ncbi:MAG TPA: VWA domain-containing protein [Pyrinomonadaceae bacterium]|jgi:VWA domain containing CoxE-like protein.|nr:VWA domain-containing protein [Pyrinomonadaceae bacterium]
MNRTQEDSLARWRLVLGKYARDQIPAGMSAQQQRIENALDFLYSREYRGRGVRDQEEESRKREGTLDPSQLTVPHWLSEVRELFPKETVALIEKHALDRYGLTELITDSEILRRLEPSFDLLKMLLTFRGHLKGEVLNEARRIIRSVVEEIKQRLITEVRRAFSGRRNRFQHSNLKMAQNLDWRGTIRKNLKNFDTQRRQIVVEQVLFFSRIQRRLPWRIILCVDQSGSMASSVIYSAVMAGILSGLPLIDVKLIVFDTSVVDLSSHVDDPVELLLSVQLGGGTNIGQAMQYCEQLVEDPHRSIVVLISDFCEGATPRTLISSCQRLREGGVKLLGLAALDESANAGYDVEMAEMLAAVGMDIAALTPKHFAEWLAKTIS